MLHEQLINSVQKIRNGKVVQIQARVDLLDDDNNVVHTIVINIIEGDINWSNRNSENWQVHASTLIGDSANFVADKVMANVSIFTAYRTIREFIRVHFGIKG